MRTRIAALGPNDAVAVPSLAAAAACLATWASGLLCGDDGVSGLRFRHARDASPAPRPPRSPRQRRLRSRTPKSSRRAPRAFRRSREAAALPRSMPVPPVLTSRLHGASDSPPPRRFERVAYPCPCRCISPATPECASIPETAPRRRQPQAVTCRACAGLQPAVRSPGLAEMAPDPPPKGGPKREQSTPWHRGGTRTEFLSACAAAALQAGSAPRHYRMLATASATALRRCDVPRQPMQ